MGIAIFCSDILFLYCLLIWLQFTVLHFDY